jgi:Domain of unknown function (DUF1707)
MAAGAAGRGRLRASDADREQVIGTLKSAFVQGMLDKDEFDLRVGQAFASRTYAELAAVTADLPAGLPAVRPPAPARAQDQQRVVRFGPTIMTVSGLYAGAWAFALLGPGWDTDNMGAVMLLLVLTFVEVVILSVAGIDKLASRHRERSGGQLPPVPTHGGNGPASQRPPSAGPAGQLPPVDHGQQHITEAGPSRLPRPQVPGWRSPRRWRPRGLLAAGGRS